MRRVFMLAVAMLVTTLACVAQSTDSLGRQTVIYIDSSGDSSLSANDGRLSLMLNGTRFDIGSKVKSQTSNANHEFNSVNSVTTKRGRKVYFGCFGIGSPNFNHLAAFEIGANAFVGSDYSMYPDAEADQMLFSNRKAIDFTINIGTLNVPLNPRNTLVFTTGWSFTMDDYTFANDNYTLELRDGMMHPVAIDGKIKKSKLNASYLRIPLLFDWNISRGFFISAGANLDILIATNLKYKFPKTIVQDEVTLNPIQVGVTARIGWKRLYTYVNYSFVDMFKSGTGPRGKRLSAGMGIWF